MAARRRARSSLLFLAVITGCGFQVPGAGSGTARPSPTPGATPTLPPAPTATAQPSPTPAPEATATPDPFVLALDAFSCEGGVVLEWSPSSDPEFHHYVALRSPEQPIPTNYPPIAPAVDWGDSFATDRFVTSAVDASILPSETPWNYRVMAYDVQGRAVGASAVRIARVREHVRLGQLQVGAGLDGVTSIAWTPYRGLARCFSQYRVMFSVGGGPSAVLSTVSDKSASSIDTTGLHSGTTYQLRVQAVRTTLQGSFVLGQTDPVSYTVP